MSILSLLFAIPTILAPPLGLHPAGILGNAAFEEPTAGGIAPDLLGHRFIENRGQWPAEVQFQASVPEGVLWVTDSGLAFDAYGPSEGRVSIKPDLSFPVALASGGGVPWRCVPASAAVAFYNFYGGSGSRRSFEHVGSYEAIVIENVYPGIDAHLYYDDSQIVYDLFESGTDAAGTSSDQVTPGEPILSHTLGVDGPLTDASQSGYASVSESINFVRFVGGSGGERATEVAIDPANGSIAVVGETTSAQFPGEPNGSPAGNGTRDAFITLLDSNGEVLWSTVFRGNNDETASGVTFMGGSIVVVGETQSEGLATNGAYQTKLQSDVDFFVATLDKQNGLVTLFTYLGGGGDDRAHSVAASPSGSVYVSGVSFSDVSNGTFGNVKNQPIADIVIVKMNPSGDGTPDWVKSYGGSGFENDPSRVDIDVNAQGDLFVGTSTSFDIQASTGCQSARAGNMDAFAMRLRPDGGVRFCTYLGGPEEDRGRGIVAASDNSSIVVGESKSDTFPVMPPGNSTYSGKGDAFVSKLDPDGKLVYSRYLGGEDGDVGLDIDATENGDTVFVVGFTASDSFPVAGAAYDSTHEKVDNNFNASQDAFLTIIAVASGDLVMSTFLGGSTTEQAHGVAVDPVWRSPVVVGVTNSSDFQPTIGNNVRGSDGFVALFQPIRSRTHDRDQITAANLEVNVYPHPIRNTGTIAYTLERPNLVTIQIFDQLGRLVSNRIRQIQAPGTHTFLLSTPELSSGTYLLRLSQGQTISTRLLVIAR